jgi:predicted nucleic acid-binding protein
MTAYVVDASVAAKWLLEEENSLDAAQLLDNTYHLHAPDYMFVEIDNLLCKRVRRKDIHVDKAREVRAAVRGFDIEVHSFEVLIDMAWEIALKSGCSIYDALYVALAVMLDIQVVTADRKMYDRLRTGKWKDNVLWVDKFAAGE